MSYDESEREPNGTVTRRSLLRAAGVSTISYAGLTAAADHPTPTARAGTTTTDDGIRWESRLDDGFVLPLDVAVTEDEIVAVGLALTGEDVVRYRVAAYTHGPDPALRWEYTAGEGDGDGINVTGVSDIFKIFPVSDGYIACLDAPEIVKLSGGEPQWRLERADLFAAYESAGFQDWPDDIGRPFLDADIPSFAQIADGRIALFHGGNLLEIDTDGTVVSAVIPTVEQEQEFVDGEGETRTVPRRSIGGGLAMTAVGEDVVIATLSGVYRLGTDGTVRWWTLSSSVEEFGAADEGLPVAGSLSGANSDADFELFLPISVDRGTGDTIVVAGAGYEDDAELLERDLDRTALASIGPDGTPQWTRSQFAVDDLTEGEPISGWNRVDTLGDGYVLSGSVTEFLFRVEEGGANNVLAVADADGRVFAGRTAATELYITSAELPGGDLLSIVVEANPSRASLRAFDPAALGDLGGTIDATPDPSPEPDPDQFDPRVHGFDFRNWEGDGQDNTERADNPWPEPHDPADVSRFEVEQTIDQVWEPEFGADLKDTVVEYFYTQINQQTVTNGHCYGMVFAALEYFNNPDALPESVESASHIPHPVGEYESVGNRINFYQNAQLLDTDSGASVYQYIRLAAVTLADKQELFSGGEDTIVDPQREREILETRIDRDGAVGVGLFGDDGNHAVVAYDYTDDGTIFVYDPSFNGPRLVTEGAPDGGERRAEEYRIEIEGDEMTYIQGGGPEAYDRFAALTDDPREIDLVDLYRTGIAMMILGGAADRISDGIETVDELRDRAGEFVDNIRATFVGIRADVDDAIELEIDSLYSLGGLGVSDSVYRTATEYTTADLAFTDRETDPTISLQGTANSDYTLRSVGATSNSTLFDTETSGSISAGGSVGYRASSTEGIVRDDEDTTQNGDEESTDNDGSAGDDAADAAEETETDTDDGFGPGFGVGGALAGVGGVAYVLKRRLGGTESEDE